MSPSTPRPATPLLALVITLVVVAASAALVVRLTGGGGDGGDRSTTAAPTTAATAATATPGATESTGPRSSSNLSPRQARTVDELKAQVSEIRGLEWHADVPIRIVAPEELSRRVTELTAIEREKDPDDLPNLEIVLKLLQLIPDDADLTAIVDKLLAGGVLGFYDDEAKELFVGGDPGSDLDVATKSTMVHELNHALTDQHFNFGDRNRFLTDQQRDEEAFALGALVEGDAELVRILWAEEHLTSDEQLEAELGGSAGDPSVYFDTPAYVLESLFFPYMHGRDFVSAVHDEGGFAAVDDAYRQPPASSEEILHPDRYVPGQSWDRPSVPDLAAATGCTAVDTSTIGEFDMTQLLDRHLAASEARTGAAGWNGDLYRLVRCGDAVGMVDRWRADTPADLAELADALGRWAAEWSGSDRAPDGDGRFSGPDGSGRIIRSADRLDLVIADDASTSDRLAAAVLAA